MNPVRTWFRRQTLQVVHRFNLRLARYKLVSRRRIRDELLADAAVRAAIDAHAAVTGKSPARVHGDVERYIREIVPFFNVLSYYKIGYTLARALINLLYRPAVTWEAGAALSAIPPRDVVVYLMNHRSNADYVVVAYVLAHGVSISYAVGEWARTWPLEYVFKSFGAYFVRRRFREPLYHAVLERYVQLITRHGVTQGIFLEGGLSRDGALRPAKIGLLDYVVRTVRDARFDRDIWLVPVALTYDRVLEDRALIRELVDPGLRRGRPAQAADVVRYVASNLLRLITGRLKRYGRVAVNFGTPFSVRSWAAAHPGVLTLPTSERLPHVQRLADEMLGRIATIMPVTPVPLAAAALLSFGETAVRHDALLQRIADYRDHLVGRDAKVVHAEREPAAILERAWRTFGMRRVVYRDGDTYVILPAQRPLLEYYANAIGHLLPAPPHRGGVAHPALEPDTTLPRLRRPSG